MDLIFTNSPINHLTRKKLNHDNAVGSLAENELLQLIPLSTISLVNV